MILQNHENVPLLLGAILQKEANKPRDWAYIARMIGLHPLTLGAILQKEANKPSDWAYLVRITELCPGKVIEIRETKNKNPYKSQFIEIIKQLISARNTK